MNRAWVFVALCLLGTVAGELPAAASFIGRALADPLVLFSLALAFAASLAWIAAMSRLTLGQAYPFMSLAFVFTALLSTVFLGEPISTVRWAGLVVVVAGLVLVAEG
jgi:drug/metabolite transporter (DMT)-like permease